MKKICWGIIFFCCLSYGYAQKIWIEEVTASSELTDSRGSYPADNLCDYTSRSWAEGARGNGIGESFTLTLRDKQQIAGFALKNGYGDLNYFTRNNRVKSFKIYIDGSYIETIPVKDSIHFEQHPLKKPVAGTKIKFVIDSVYQGTAYNDTCIAEIALLSDVLSDEVFYNRILEILGVPSGEPTIWNTNAGALGRAEDPDRIRLLEYMPFDFEYSGYKTKIALLDRPSSLRLTSDLPRLDGATAAYPLYSAFVHAVYPEIEPEGAYGQDWPYFPNREAANRGYDDFSSLVQCSKTAEAYQRLIDGETDLIFCYEPSPAEIEAARAKGITFNLTPIAKDAFVFIVNSKNTMNNITRGQVRDIYSGRVTNWKTINGNDDVIIPYQRQENSGSQTIFQTIMGGEKAQKPILDGEYIPWGMFGMINIVASDYYNYNSAIGYTFLFYLNHMTGNANVKTLSIDGIPPTWETIRSGVYPFAQTVYAVTAGNESENTKRFIDWICSAQGQELVEKTGYIPIRE
ncbi:MAG: substrate-binding domain-containing protein [Treponema sp.]|nr:substrate-binding domain-containing protein [Treponema sp.]